MTKWYKVTKTINGRRYDYWQRTERHGKQTKTFNKYIGPSRTLLKGQPIPGWRTMSASSRYNVKLERVFHDAEILNRQYDALREAETSFQQKPFTVQEMEVYNTILHADVQYQEYLTRKKALDAQADPIHQMPYGPERDEAIRNFRLREADLDAFFKPIQWRTLKKYNSGAPAAPTQYEQTVAEHRDHLSHAEYTPPVPEVIEPEPRYTRRELGDDEWREMQRYKREQKREFDARMKVVAAKVRKAKRAIKGVKSANPFLAQALVEK